MEQQAIGIRRCPDGKEAGAGGGNIAPVLERKLPDLMMPSPVETSCAAFLMARYSKGILLGALGPFACLACAAGTAPVGARSMAKDW